MGYIWLIVLGFLFLAWLFNELMKQSKKPKGILGALMMSIWNRAYLPMVRWSVQLITLKPNGQILDIGVGNGASTAYLGTALKPSKIIGIDISEQGISLAQEKNKLENSQFMVADVCQLPFEDQQFDFVTAFQTHFHWQNFEAGLAEIQRVMKMRGTVLLACETNKVSYYLKEYETLADMTQLAQKLGFQEAELYQHSQWSAYILKN